MDPAQNSDINPSANNTGQTVPAPITPITNAGLPSTPQPEPPIDTPRVINPEETQTVQVPAEPPSKKKLFFFLFLLFFFFILILGGGGLTYLVAYEKVKLEKYPDLQKNVSYFVLNLPFMPKTPKFLLEKSGLKHQDVTKQSFDISVAVDSKSLLSELGLSNLDVQAKGAIDYTDPKNLKIILDASLTKDFNFELKKKDKILYFKINKVPSFLLAFLGIKNEDLTPVLNKWIAYDTTPLETEARKEIMDKPVDPLSEEFLEDNFNKYIDDKVLAKMKLSEVIENDIPMHKISLVADTEIIDDLGKKLEEENKKSQGAYLDRQQDDEAQKLSDVLKSLEWEIFIDKKEYYTRKIAISAEVEYDQTSFGGNLLTPPNPTSPPSTANIVFVAKSGDFGKDLVIETPDSAMSFEEFTDSLSDIFREIYSGEISQLSGGATDTKRMSDLFSLSTALEMYRADCESYPEDLASLTSKTDSCVPYSGPYIVTIPKDPDGSEYYYKLSEDKTAYYLCANLEAAPANAESCPDPNYNYTIGNRNFSP